MERTRGRFCAVKPPPVCPPRAKPSGQRRVPGHTGASPPECWQQKQSSLPPSLSALWEAGEMLWTVLFLAHADAPTWRCRMCRMYLSSLHGLALEIRRDDDVSSLWFCIFFLFSSQKNKKTNKNSSQRAGVCPAGSSVAGGARLQRPRRGGSSRDPPPSPRQHRCRAAVRGGNQKNKTKNIFAH